MSKPTPEEILEHIHATKKHRSAGVTTSNRKAKEVGR